MDLAELWTNANRALDNLYNTKGSIDTRRWSAVWELCILLHQNESPAAATIKEAKVTCSQPTLDAWTACSWSILRAKTNFLTAVKEAKTTRGHLVQEAEAACSKAICEAEAWKVSKAAIFHKEHDNYMQDLKEQTIGEESRSHNGFLSTCQVILYHSPPQLRGALTTSYHLLLGQTPLSPSLDLLQKTSPVEEQPTTAASPTPAPIQSPRPKRQCPLPDPLESMPMGGTTPRATLGGSPSPKRQEIPSCFRMLKPSSAKAFCQDSDMVKEARMEFFLKHSCNFTIDGTCNLSKTFRQLAASVNLLGTSILEIQSSRTGPDEPKQANYALLSLSKGLKFLWLVPPSESPKVMGLMGIHEPDALCRFGGITYCPWCGKEGQMKGLLSIIYKPYTTG